MSRTTGTESNSENHEQDDEILHTTAFYKKWLDEEWYTDVYMYLEALMFRTQDTKERQRVRSLARRFLLQNDILYRRDSDNTLKTCLVRGEVLAILKDYHDGSAGGHFGRDITIERARRLFWWPTMWKDIAE